MELRISDIPQRTPVINEENKASFADASIERQWRYFTESVRRRIISDHATRVSLVQFCLMPVSEELPNAFLQAAQAGLPELTRAPSGNLQKYLGLPPIPASYFNPDLKNPVVLYTPERHVAMYRDIGMSDAEIVSELQDSIERGDYTEGIVREELQMVIRRYRFARDVKLLALGAELAEHPNPQPVDEGNLKVFSLPSGIRIATTLQNAEEQSDLLMPHMWEKRRQLKDRVYEVEVNGRKYILKERKTNRHTDTKKGGHRLGLSSEDEFKTARFFHEHNTVRDGDVMVTWEEPIASVTFPDGFQFAVFHYEEGLIDIKNAHSTIKEAILERRDAFEEEYQRVSESARVFVRDPRIVKWAWATKDKNVPYRRLKLTFEDYAVVKAYFLMKKADELQDRIMDENNFRNSDMDGYAFRIQDGNPFTLERLGFDFEYFEKLPDSKMEERKRRLEEWKLLEANRPPESSWTDTRIRQAAYLALEALPIRPGSLA